MSSLPINSGNTMGVIKNLRASSGDFDNFTSLNPKLGVPRGKKGVDSTLVTVQEMLEGDGGSAGAMRRGDPEAGVGFDANTSEGRGIRRKLMGMLSPPKTKQQQQREYLAKKFKKYGSRGDAHDTV